MPCKNNVIFNVGIIQAENIKTKSEIQPLPNDSEL